MYVRLLAEMSFGEGLAQVGSLREVSDAQGQALIDVGLAEAVTMAVPETATLENAPENATMPRGRKR